MITYYKNGVKYCIEEANMCKHCVRDGNCRFADDYKKKSTASDEIRGKILRNFLCEYFTLDKTTITNKEEY